MDTMIQLLSIATGNDAPAIYHGRFTERERKREWEVQRRLAQRFGTPCPQLRAMPGG